MGVHFFKYFCKKKDALNKYRIFIGRAPPGRAFRCKSSPLVPHACGLSAAIPHAGNHLTNPVRRPLSTALFLLALFIVKQYPEAY
jgi:hypothetical protein